MKFIKVFLSIIIGLIVIIFVGVLIFLNSIKVEVTDDDLPQGIYTETGDLESISQVYLLGIVVASDADQYTLINGFMNYMILDSIRKNINPDYDPLADLDTVEADYVTYDKNFYIDYIYANLNDDNQIVVTAAFGSDSIIKVDSALNLVFDIDLDISFTNIGFTLTLVDYSLSDTALSFQVLDFIMSKLDKTEIEGQMSMGVLDLDTYTYTLSILNP
ncbi:hypothetical protein [Mariniplasma anaerobium]|nr:hypothetical protein [Mariniplasma anaerobium]